MNQYFFSIIIPARSCNTFFEKETLPAIAKLSYKRFETIILADDISGFQKFRKRYPWMRTIRSSSRPGIKRDEGAKKAKGDFLAFIDDDAFPSKNWLRNANGILQADLEVVALGGPGILPKNATFWEQVFNESVMNGLGSGGYAYRFRKGKKQYVDDYPSMNLIMSKKIFLKIGGFDNHFWPGEDSKLIKTLIEKEKKMVLYHPNIVVYHHRRDTIREHVKQYKRYGTMRGMFFTQGDMNSINVQYVIPSLLLMYYVLYVPATLLFIARPFHPIVFLVLSLPAIFYIGTMLLVIYRSFLRTKNLLISLALLYVIPLTHLVYGYFFMLGTIQEMLATPKERS